MLPVGRVKTLACVPANLRRKRCRFRVLWWALSASDVYMVQCTPQWLCNYCGVLVCGGFGGVRGCAAPALLSGRERLVRCPQEISTATC